MGTPQDRKIEVSKVAMLIILRFQGKSYCINSDGLSMADISFLLPFLRVRYFSQLEALKLLDNFMTRRAKFPQWFGNLDPGDPKIQDAYDRG